jgi:hypothetical protein
MEVYAFCIDGSGEWAAHWAVPPLKKLGWARKLLFFKKQWSLQRVEVSRTPIPLPEDWSRPENEVHLNIVYFTSICTSYSGLENREYDRGDSLRWSRSTLYPQKLALTSPISGGRSVDIDRLRTKATEFTFFMYILFWRRAMSKSNLFCKIVIVKKCKSVALSTVEDLHYIYICIIF